MSYLTVPELHLPTLDETCLRWFNEEPFWMRQLSKKKNELNGSFKLHDNALFVTYDVPGCEPSSVSVELEKNRLIVSARRDEHNLSHSLVINDDYDLERTSARLRHGELVIMIPRRAPPAKRRVEVKLE